MACLKPSTRLPVVPPEKTIPEPRVRALENHAGRAAVNAPGLPSCKARMFHSRMRQATWEKTAQPSPNESDTTLNGALSEPEGAGDGAWPVLPVSSWGREVPAVCLKDSRRMFPRCMDSPRAMSTAAAAPSQPSQT